MTGIFDSGSGGLFTLRILRRLVPDEEMAFLSDRENAPYGTKSKGEIISLADANITRLHRAGCERVLIACCTASAIHGELPKEKQAVSIPILLPTARQAAGVTMSGRVAVIATDATVRSHLFSDALAGYGIQPFEIATQELVGLVDGGCGRLGEKSHAYISHLAGKIKNTGADTLVLGCTHFHAAWEPLSDALRELNRKISIVSSAEVGAKVARDEIYSARAKRGKEFIKWENTEEAELTTPSERSLLSRSAT